MARNNFLTDPVDCTTPTLPALPADYDCEAVPGLSQLGYLVIAQCAAGDPFEIVSPATTPTLVSGGIDNDDTSKARVLVGTGAIDEHEPVIYEGSFLRDKVVERNFTGTFNVPIGTARGTGSMYEFLRNLQSLGSAEPEDVRIWYVDLSGALYGPVLDSAATTYGGIRLRSINVQMPNGSARDDRKVAVISFAWRADVDPPSYVSPLTESAACIPA